jgi:rod shape determining protein RodA
MSASRTISRLDLNLLTTALLIAAIGCMLVYSATYFGPEAPLFRKQVIWTLIGIILMVLFIAVDYHVLMEIAPFLYAVGIILLTYLLISDRLTRNVKSWIHIGNFQFQPSEFMKIFTALLIAKYFDSNDRAYLDVRSFAVVMGMIGFPVILIALQPAFGSAASFFPLFGVAMFLAASNRSCG